MHSVYSDGSHEPEVILQKVREAGLDLFSLTDHDSFKGCARMRELLKPGDPVFINGIEFSCRDQFGKYHILGYHFEETESGVARAADWTHFQRIDKAIRRFDYIEQKTGCRFTDEERQRILSEHNPGRPHFARMAMEKGLASDFSEAFQLISGLGGNSRYLTAKEAIEAILESGGIPVLAHGILEEGSGHLTFDELKERTRRLMNYGLKGMECFYSSYTADEVNGSLSLSKELGLVVTAGSDFHGPSKSAVGNTNHPDPKAMEAFYELL